MILRLIDDIYIKDIDLSQSFSDLVFFNVHFEMEGTNCHFKTTEGSVFFQGGYVTTGTLHANDVYWVAPESKRLFMVLEQLTENGFALPSLPKVAFGRSDENTLVLKNSLISRKHGYFIQKGNDFFVADTNSTHGIYVNDKRIVPNQEIKLQPGSIIKIGKYSLIVSEKLFFCNSDSSVALHALKQSEYYVPQTTAYPYFSRAPRILPKFSTITVKIDDAPSIGSKPGMGMMGIALNPTMIALSVGMQAIRYALSKKKYSKQEQQLAHVYGEYLADIEKTLRSHNEQQRIYKNRLYPTLHSCIQKVANKELTLWEKHPHNDDFLTVRLGEGSEPAQVHFVLPEKKLSLTETEFDKLPGLLKESYQQVDKVPITVNLSSSGSCGIVGPRSAATKVAQSMVAQLTALHSYEDVKIVVLFEEAERDHYAWMRFLPHCYSKQRDIRYIACDNTSAKPILDRLDKEISERSTRHNEWSFAQNAADLPHYIFVVANAKLLDGTACGAALAKNDPSIGVSGIILADTLSSLPHSVTNLLYVRQELNQITLSKTADHSDSFRFSEILSDEREYETFSRKMAPIRLSDTVETQEKGIPQSISIFEGIHVKKLEDADVLELWNSARPENSLAVPLGIKSGGEIYNFDIHEKKQGPHGLIAGGTGSGKSKMVQTWIAMMAMQYSPEHVNFVLVDFKGESLIEPFRNLPHLACYTHDNDPDVCRKLLSIESEMSRREQLFSRYQCDDISTYIKRRRENPDMEPLPYLFFIVDEFAAFKAEFPEFTQPLERLFQQGRSLGFFAIVMTQSPSGKVTTQMNTNLGFRWCLRVDEGSSDSKEMLGTDDATHLRIPGRAYVKAKDGTYELIQTFYGHALYDPNADKEKHPEAKVYALKLNGLPKATQSGWATEKVEANEQKQLWVLSEYLNRVCEQNRIPKAKPIWQKALPTCVSLDNLPCTDAPHQIVAAIGVYDSPKHQKQETLYHNFSENGSLLVYGMPKTGKSTFLQSIVLSLCQSKTPEEVQFYMLEAGGFAMRSLEKIPHVGAAAGDDEPEAIKNILDLLLKELETRKKLFRAEGTGDIETYREVTGNSIPAIIFMIDHVNTLFQQFYDHKENIIKLVGEGQSKGIYFAGSCDGTTGLDMKLSQKIKTRYALRLSDRSDYLTLVGKITGSTENLPIGRGFYRTAEETLAFQTAIWGGDQPVAARVKALRNLAAELSFRWQGKRPKGIFTIPEELSRDDIDTDRSGVIGIFYEDGVPACVNHEETVSSLISCGTQEARNNFLSVIVKEYQKANGSIYLYHPDPSSLPIEKQLAEQVFNTSEELDGYIDRIAEELRNRQRVQKENASAHFSPLLIVINGLLQLLSEAQEMTILRLEVFVRLGEKLGIHVMALDDAGNMNRAFYMNGNLLISTLKKGTKMLIGGNLADHHLIDTVSLRSQQMGPLPFDKGLYQKTVSEKAKFVKLIRA